MSTMGFDSLKIAIAESYCRRDDNPYQLSSGATSSEYVDVKFALMHSRTLHEACEWIKQFLVSDYVGGSSIPAALLVGGLLHASRLRLSAFVVREKPKGHGTQKVIEGVIPPKGTHVLLVEDVITTGDSILTTARMIERTGCTVGGICALVDREAGGVQSLAGCGYQVDVLTTLGEIRRIRDDLARANFGRTVGY